MSPSNCFTLQDLSYAHTSKTRSGRAFIRLMENSTGRLELIKRAAGYDAEVAQGQGFFEVMARRYGLSLQVEAGSLNHIPRTGPVIVMANHPYGILDGLMMGRILSHRRDDFKIIAHSVFNKVPELSDKLLPISFDGDKPALAMNLHTRKKALDHLTQGGAIGVFPGGTVSTAARPFSEPMDPRWRGFTARMIAKSNAVVVPVYFDGHTSRLFQIASHLNHTLRMGLLVRQFSKRVDAPVRVVIGEPIGRNVLNPLAKDAKAMMDFLRKATYELSPRPTKSFGLGLEF